MNNINFISPYGFKPIAIALGLAFFCYIADFEILENLFILLTLGLIYIYGDTSRHIFENNQSVLSPIDGKVIAIDSIDNTKQIYVKVNLCGNHHLRAPFNSEFEIDSFKYGVNLNPVTPKAKLLNEQADLKFTANDNGKTQIKLKLISGMCNPAIELKEGIESLSQGEKIGFFIEGIVIISLDKDMKIFVNIGDKLKSGQSLITKID